jgi:hypothetical protein
VRTSSYLLSESPIASLIHGVDPVQKQILWNGDLFDARSARDAVNSLESLICQQRGNSVDIIAHSLGTVIAYTALAELAGLPGTNRSPACISTQVVNFVTLASPLGLDDTLPQRLGALSGIKIPAVSEVGSAHALRITGRWLNVWATGDRIGGKIDLPSVVNVSFSLEQSSFELRAAHRFPYKDANVTRMVADVIFGARARLVTAAPAPVQPSSAPTNPEVNSTLPDTANRGVIATDGGLSGDEVVKALGSTKEQNRAAAITEMVKQGAIRSPLTADELAAILKGTTGGNRSYAIAQLSALINPLLTAPEAATVLGSANELREQNRAAAIRSLARTTVPGSWGAEASEPLNGSTGGNRSYAIAQLASLLRANLTGMEVATILGQPEELREQNRAAAIRNLVDAGRLRLPFSGNELSLVLTGTTGGNRSYAIGLLTKRR